MALLGIYQKNKKNKKTINILWTTVLTQLITSEKKQNNTKITKHNNTINRKII